MSIKEKQNRQEKSKFCQSLELIHSLYNKFFKAYNNIKDAQNVHNNYITLTVI